MADEFTLHSSMDLPTTEFNFARKDFVYIPDNNNGSYSSGSIILDLASVANSNKYISWKESTLLIPIVLNIQHSSATGFSTSANNAYALSLLNGVHHLFNSISLQLANNEIVAVQSFSNVLQNFKILSSFSPADVENLGATMLFQEDTANAFNFDATASANGLGLSNNNIVSTTGGGLDNFTPALASASAGLTFNKGRATRMQYTSLNAVDTNSVTTNFVTANTLTTVMKNSVVERSQQSITYHITAEICMRWLHDYFLKCPMMKNSYYKLIINTHLPTTATLVTATGTATYNTATVNSPYGVCPFQVSPLSTDSTTGLGLSAVTGVQTMSVKMGISSVTGTYVNVLAHPLSSCRLYACLLTPTPLYEQIYLKNPVKQLLYNDYLSYNTMTNIVSGGTVNQLLTPSLSRLRTLYLFPFLSASANGNSGLQQMNSPFDSCPSVCAPYAYLTNLQVQLSGMNIYQEVKTMRFQNFLEEVRPKNSINGGLLAGLSSGLIDCNAYNTTYPVIVVDLSRKNVEDDDIAKSVLVSFINSSRRTLDILGIIEYEKALNLNVEVGSIVL